MKTAAVALMAMFTCSAYAQVYKCDQNGKTVYGDAPCLGAKRVNVTPTQGADKWTGKSKKGEDVRTDEFQTAMSKALKPLLGETPEQYKTRHRRTQAGLTMRDMNRCTALDRQLQALEQTERDATGERLESTQKQLLQVRQQYYGMKC